MTRELGEKEDHGWKSLYQRQHERIVSEQRAQVKQSFMELNIVRLRIQASW